ncbi:MAG TPA: alkaline phosphatase family protein, partial [Bacteroidales bacterium]|nr:alkaline phosphatase family protein [Bacteroidales bacterium]
WGGRLPDQGDPDVAGVPWGLARVDKETGATREGSVSVFDPATGKCTATIVTGLHPNEITASPDGRFVYLTTSNSDAVTVINTSADTIAEVIPVRLQPEINPYFGDSPNGLGLSPDGRLLYVANGMDNALVVIRLGKSVSSRGKGKSSTISGFIPTGTYPSSVVVSKENTLYVTNLEGDSRKLPIPSKSNSGFAYNSHHKLTSISIIDKPGRRKLKRYTNTVIAMNQLSRLVMTGLPARSSILPAPVPERTGEPSVFKHVLYIIKENRTYDQVLGDMLAGDGDPALCIYGDTVTPNTHKLADRFLLLDNFSVAGKCSAEGHQWTDASIVTDYIEKNMRAWFRSYPHVQTDALVYAPTGFLWDNAVRNGKSVKIYGEAAIPEFDHTLSWSDIYTNYKKGIPFTFSNKTTIAPVRPLLSSTFPAYDSHKIPDQLRADAFIKDLHTYETMEGDHLPELMIMALPNDHTAGTRPGLPTPRAAIADNDLALGRIIEAITKSRFWKETVIFVTEDDSQAGWDHVSPYRTVGLVISPYSVLEKTVHTPYNQQGMVRTIELILGLPPMNIEDAIAAPMYDCFGEEKVEVFYDHIPSHLPLDELNPPLSALKGKSLHYAKQSLNPVFDHIDSGEDDLLNRILWFSSKSHEPYPSDLSGSGDEEEGE